jgi:ADP-L-glycero-D-manno-heptose 6-epimerase
MNVVVTGGAGFIGSCFLWKLNQQGIDSIYVVDELGTSEKWKNLVGKRFKDYIDKDDFLHDLASGVFDDSIDAIVHLGACSATTETDASYLMDNNYTYTKILAEWAHTNNKRFLYASSAATYGAGEHGYSDDDSLTPQLAPLNMYGYSKQLFDLWVLRQGLEDTFIGMKFFNVFGPNEYHKDDMRSMVHKGYQQIKSSGTLKLFKSYHPDYSAGEQKRDFLYVKDAVDIMFYFLEHPKTSGIVNVGTGRAHSWNDLARGIFAALKKKESISYIDMPETLKEKYQYFTEADVSKLRSLGYTKLFTPFEEAIKDYVNILETTHYL